MTEQIQAVQRMQDYIEDHLQETITLAQLAKVSLFSPWYSHRLFKKYTGLTPADYIRRLRLSRSALQLRDEGSKIVDIAFQLGFGSVDGYQRAFYREFGRNPGEYAAKPVPLYLFIPYGVQYRALRKESRIMEPTKTISVQVVTRPACKVILKRGVSATDYFSYCEEVGCEVWGLLTSIPSLSGEPINLWLPPADRLPGTSEYVQGVEVPLDDQTPVPSGFDVIQIPPAHYLRFQGEPFQEEDYCQAIQETQAAIRTYDSGSLGYVWDPTLPRYQLEPIGSRGYIEFWPVRPI